MGSHPAGFRYSVDVTRSVMARSLKTARARARKQLLGLALFQSLSWLLVGDEGFEPPTYTV